MCNEKDTETVSVSAKVFDPTTRVLLFREACGFARMEGLNGKIEVSHHATNGSPIVGLPDGSFVLFPWEGLIRAAIGISGLSEVCQR